MRAPGMTMFRMPIFTWTVLVTSILVLLVFPVLAAALFALGADRRFGAHVFDPGERRADALAAHVLVLRAPGGLHHRAAVLRHHLRGAAGLLAQADLRLQDPRLRDDRHRRPVGQRLGAPHVRHRSGAAAVLRDHDDADRRADGREVLQLDRHDVGRQGLLRHPDAVGDRLPGDLPLRRPDRRHPGQPGARLPPVRHLLRRGALPLRRVRHRRLRDVRRLLLLVAEAHRPDARRAAGQDPLLAAVHRLPHHLPHPAPARHAGDAAALRRLPARGRLHPRQPDLHGGRLHPRLVDDPVPATTSGRPGASRRSSRPTTRGATAPRSSGPPRARRRGTTSTPSPGSVPSDRHSTCTTPRP